jgi:hypothetical protein
MTGMRYGLRTLLVVTALGPVVFAGGWWAVSWMFSSPANFLAVIEGSCALVGLGVLIALAVVFGNGVARVADAVMGLWNDP